MNIDDAGVPNKPAWTQISRAAVGVLLLVAAYGTAFGTGIYVECTQWRNGIEPAPTTDPDQWRVQLVWMYATALLGLVVCSAAMVMIGQKAWTGWMRGLRPAVPGSALATVGTVWLALELPPAAHLVADPSLSAGQVRMGNIALVG